MACVIILSSTKRVVVWAGLDWTGLFGLRHEKWFDAEPFLSRYVLSIQILVRKRCRRLHVATKLRKQAYPRDGKKPPASGREDGIYVGPDGLGQMFSWMDFLCTIVLWL